MKPGTRMMMISSLGEDMNGEARRRMGFQSNDERRMEYPESRGGSYEPESEYEGSESSYDGRVGSYGAQSRDGYEGRLSSRGYRRAENMSPWRREKMARELGEDRYRERMETEKREMRGNAGQRRMERRMDARSHYGEEDEDDMSGSFRPGKAQRHVPEEGEEELSEERVRKWVNGMQGSDGKSGAYYPMDQSELLRASYCQNCDKLEFWAAVNMMHSDYCEVAKRMGVDRPEFYAHMAKAFLMDKDAPGNKLAMYMTHIAGK